jgi:hypothetical protein
MRRKRPAFLPAWAVKLVPKKVSKRCRSEIAKLAVTAREEKRKRPR